MPELIDRVADHCQTLQGATRRQPDEFGLLRGFLDIFARFFVDESPPSILLRVLDDEREALAVRFKGVRKSEHMQWETEGWSWTDVPLDGSIPEKLLKELIDRSYGIVFDSKNDLIRLIIELIGQKLPANALLSTLIDRVGMGGKRDAIMGLAQNALLLRTTIIDEADSKPGSSRVGGLPDLPSRAEWPRHASGKPLAFLAQINLAEAANILHLSGFPRSGLLQFFSVYGWQEDGEYDPQFPPGAPAHDWTTILYHTRPTELVQRATPLNVNVFPAAAVEFIPILSLPTSEQEPARAALHLTTSEDKQFDALYSAFSEATLYALGYPRLHQLGGYAHYEQEFIAAVADQQLALLFQLASDDNSQMMWGDGGYIYFFDKPAHIALADYSSVVTDYQCG